ncbi:MAG: four helix bundle protein [Chitinophagaceae bacterium]|jgi:four helix bundle protein|nr:four helix bundle protein [Chitinophagaceae bacterium]
MNERIFDLEDRLIGFASRIIDVVEALPNTQAGIYVGGQLIRCGLAPALLYGEAQAAESRDDFIHKMKIALKELKETRVCLKLIQKKEMIKPLSKMNAIMQENEELIAINSKSVNTAKQNIVKTKKSFGS